MSPAEAITAMRERASTIEIERARIAGSFRTICDIGGIAAVRAVVKAELERLTPNANDNGEWIG